MLGDLQFYLRFSKAIDSAHNGTICEKQLAEILAIPKAVPRLGFDVADRVRAFLRKLWVTEPGKRGGACENSVLHDIHYMPRYSTEAAYFQTLDVDVPMLHLLHMRCSCMLCFESQPIADFRCCADATVQV